MQSSATSGSLVNVTRESGKANSDAVPTMFGANSSKTEPLISVIVPTYNRVKTIHRAIASALSQTYPHIELIVVDDGSSDNTAAIVDSVLADNLVFLRQSENRGASAARNIGAKAARGTYLAFLDSDDEWFPTKLEHQFRRFLMGTNDSAGLDVVFCENANKKITSKDWPNDDVHSWITSRGGLTWSTMMVKSESFVDIGGFDEQLQVSEWWDLVFRLSKNCRFALLREPYVITHDPQGPRLWTLSNRQGAARAIIGKYGSDIPHYRKFRSWWFLGIASRAMTANQPGEAREAAMSAMRALPSFKALGFIVVSLLGDWFYRKSLTLWQKRKFSVNARKSLR